MSASNFNINLYLSRSPPMRSSACKRSISVCPVNNSNEVAKLDEHTSSMTTEFPLITYLHLSSASHFQPTCNFRNLPPYPTSLVHHQLSLRPPRRGPRSGRPSLRLARPELYKDLGDTR